MEGRGLGGGHRTEEVAHEVGTLELQGVEEIDVVKGQVQDVIQALNAVRLTEAGVDRRVDREPLGQPVEERRPSLVAEGPVEVDERVSRARFGDAGGDVARVYGQLSRSHRHTRSITSA